MEGGCGGYERAGMRMGGVGGGCRQAPETWGGGAEGEPRLVAMGRRRWGDGIWGPKGGWAAVWGSSRGERERGGVFVAQQHRPTTAGPPLRRQCHTGTDEEEEVEPKMRRSLRGGEAGAGEKGMEILPSSGREQRMEDGGVDGRSFLFYFIFFMGWWWGGSGRWKRRWFGAGSGCRGNGGGLGRAAAAGATAAVVGRIRELVAEVAAWSGQREAAMGGGRKGGWS